MAGEDCSQTKKSFRIYMDGCFDIAHYGHANATRQARQCGDYLIAGVHSDAEITANKGPPVYPEEERYKIIRAFRWVDEVYENAPFSTPVELLRDLNVDRNAHGDDLSISAETGLDSLHAIKSAGLFQEVQRTKGISTTDLVGRILLLTKNHHIQLKPPGYQEPIQNDINLSAVLPPTVDNDRQMATDFLARSTMIAEFSPRKTPKKNDKVVYTAGAFDMMHAGHVDFLEAAKKEGDFLIVGIHTDSDVNRYKGANFPIVNLHERALTIMALKYVDEVIIGAPFELSETMMDNLQVSVVVHGKTEVPANRGGGDPYRAAKSRAMFKFIDSGSDLSTDIIVKRILNHRSSYAERNRLAIEKFRRQELYKEEMKKKSLEGEKY